MEIHLCRFHGLMSQPEGNHRSIDTVLQKVHRGAVPQDMGGHIFAAQGGTALLGCPGMFRDQALDRIPAEWPAAAAGKDWLLRQAVTLLQPAAQHGRNFLA